MNNLEKWKTVSDKTYQASLESAGGYREQERTARRTELAMHKLEKSKVRLRP